MNFNFNKYLKINGDNDFNINNVQENHYLDKKFHKKRKTV